MSLRCLFGFHDASAWYKRMTEPLVCARCGKVAKEPCPNCGRVHDPSAFLIVCTVTRYWS